MLDFILLKLYFITIAISIIFCGLFANLVMKAKSYEEENKWERYLIISFTVTIVTIFAGIVTLILFD